MNDLSYWTSTGWLHVEALTINQAACLLALVDPSQYEGNRVLPGEARAMAQAIEQAILLRRLPVAAAWAYDPQYGETVAVANDDLTLHLNLSTDSTILVADLVAWCEKKGIEHCWPVRARDSGTDSFHADYPAELRAAIEAFNAVRADTRATAGKHPRQALSDWLAKNKPELSANARERVASVANWQPGGGAPKTPG